MCEMKCIRLLYIVNKTQQPLLNPEYSYINTHWNYIIRVESSVWTKVTYHSAEMEGAMGKEVNERHYKLQGLSWK